MILAARDTAFSILLFGGFFVACIVVGGTLGVLHIRASRRYIQKVVDEYINENEIVEVVDTKLTRLPPAQHLLHHRKRAAWIKVELRTGEGFWLRFRDGELTRFEE